MADRPVVLVILDGWGLAPPDPGNAVRAARTPTMDRLSASYPYTTLRASGLDVGLPAGQMGNSEVGHLNLGAGFVVYQWISRIDAAIADGSFFQNPALVGAVERAKSSGRNLHLLGLLGNGGVHASQQHLYALLRLAQQHGLERVFVHAFTDGRDTPPTSGEGFMRELLEQMRALGVGRVASVSGRYYAMDRDQRWPRTAQAYDAVVCGKGAIAPDPLAAITRSYTAEVTDEFILPTVIVGQDQRPLAPIQPGDSVIVYNFRSDRPRQLTQALSEPGFAAFERCATPSNLAIITMTEYEKDLPVTVAFPPQDVEYPLARILAQAGLAQFHTAETEKYAHVTYFFNGGREEPFPGEERRLVPSPKVATYDLQPEMSAAGVTEGVVGAIRSGRDAFIIVNFANCDMVGHTGVFAAAVNAVETADRCLREVIEATLAAGGVALVTADHGNAEEMLIPGTKEVWTAHTTNPVPFVLVAPVGDPLRHAKLRAGGRLADVAPTVLAVLGLPQPPVMTGQSLIADVPTNDDDSRR
ncbi:MAG TPA: 2,3-bisphosphoglycerate-independent phosphoglycerate mutase [Nitrolancea sp.]|nr:2,3-bisphosphoglycerate-independent phosphoglycerate mutase [Nitrolancea sp.]